ncbi:MAG: hypothetical protein Faunusvirus8_36 [Faunusvirus sp.]|jgi:hypothetical protein|uniref:Uncharacterized protein n=1 Tax=Faunusvirus sp. TaxID=2487766 RepID=A0A3G5A1E3_9VIRU|nr:MAG: hypothetical protein Faunusvirus8_36 [Faunusvirus sp.]
MSYTVTDVPLKKLHWLFQGKQKCEHHKFSDGTEFMMYTITKHKKETSFIFDPEDFDVVDGREWRSIKNGKVIYYFGNRAIKHLIGVFRDKHYPGQFISQKQIGLDYRKSNFVVG